MLTIPLQPRNPKPLYQQICDGICHEIAVGNLQPHAKLPSRRSLASHLQVSSMTIQTAYEQLTAEGYLYAKPRSGYYVASDAPLSERLSEINPQKETPVPTSPTIPKAQIVFATGGVDLEQFPFSIWAKLSRQVLSSRQEALLQALPAMGLRELQVAIFAHLRAFRNLHAEPEQILIGAGTEYLLGILVQLLGASKRYAAEDPGYPKSKRILRSNGASVLPISMDQSGIDIAKLEQSGATVALVTPSHQFPTGKIMPIRRRKQLLEWTEAQSGRYLIEDDYDNELRFSGKPLPSLYSMDTAEHVIYMNTFARTLAPSLRIGYLMLPQHLAERYARDFSFYASSVPAFEQYTLAQFLRDGSFERHLNRMKKTYRQRQAQLIALLQAHPMGQYLRIAGTEAGLHLRLRVQLPYTEQELVQAAANAGVVIHGLGEYFETPVPPKSPPQIILGYACLTPTEIAEGVTKMLDSWERL